MTEVDTQIEKYLNTFDAGKVEVSYGDGVNNETFNLGEVKVTKNHTYMFLNQEITRDEDLRESVIKQMQEQYDIAYHEVHGKFFIVLPNDFKPLTINIDMT